MKASSTFSPGEDSTRITLSRTLRLITEKNTPAFFWSSQLMFSAPQYPVFPAGSGQRDTPDWMLGVKANRCKTAVYCLPGTFLPDPGARLRASSGVIVHLCRRALNAKERSCIDVDVLLRPGLTFLMTVRLVWN
ncbi:hypothetical protein TNCV_236071 [Trichonephila clavipes]|nr:hypothetical protein TNCV_236071 [Trichonephila clavipes]